MKAFVEARTAIEMAMQDDEVVAEEVKRAPKKMTEIREKEA